MVYKIPPTRRAYAYSANKVELKTEYQYTGHQRFAHKQNLPDNSSLVLSLFKVRIREQEKDL